MALPLAALSALALLGGPPFTRAAPLIAPLPPLDVEEARFAPCDGPGGFTCVLDGESLFYRGTKIRLADIDAPALADAGCPAEAALGAKARDRLAALLNAGAFSLAPAPREYDTQSRRLQVVTRDARSLGARLIAEGLARPHAAAPQDWCG